MLRPLQNRSVGSAEKAGQQGHQRDAHQRHSASRHELLHSLALYLCVIKKQ